MHLINNILLIKELKIQDHFIYCRWFRPTAIDILKTNFYIFAK